MLEEQQMQAQARVRREEVRHEQQEGFASDVRCWKDEPVQCPNLPVFHVKQLDGSCYYTCRNDAEELVANLPDIPLNGGATRKDATLH